MGKISNATTVLILPGLQLFFAKTSLGWAFRATSADPATTELMGINSRQIYNLAWIGLGDMPSLSSPTTWA